MPRKDILESVYWRERGSHHVSIEPHSGSHRCCRVGRCAIADAGALLFITGAGMGVGMGLPDFRSSEQFWEELAHPEISCYEDASDSAWFDKDAALAWGLNYHQLDAYRRAEPHEGYRVLHRLAQTKGPGGYFCSSSNVDGVLQRAGFPYDRVREARVHPQIAVHERAQT